MKPAIEEQLNEAIESLTTRKYTSIRAAAKAYGVDWITLTRRLRGGRSAQETHKSLLKLSPEQETLLIRWINDLKAANHAPNHTRIREFVALICGISGDSVANTAFR